MAAALFYRNGLTAVPISFAPTVQWITTTDASVKTYTVAASFTTLMVYLDSLLCEPTESYSVSGQDVTFVDDIPVGSKITFVSW